MGKGRDFCQRPWFLVKGEDCTPGISGSLVEATLGFETHQTPQELYSECLHDYT